MCKERGGEINNIAAVSLHKKFGCKIVFFWCFFVFVFFVENFCKIVFFFLVFFFFWCFFVENFRFNMMVPKMISKTSNIEVCASALKLSRL